MDKITKSNLGIAAEFAVASELARRNIFAQPTFGHQKRTDLLIISEEGKLLRIEVKAKQGYVWPNCKGIFGDNVILVFVDFRAKDLLDRPDFYILNVQDWIELVQAAIAERPAKKVEVDEGNVPIWLDEVNARGQPYRGIGVKPVNIELHKEKWEKILTALY